ncbi:MAG: radical SAM/SPASM domain protein, ACGX system [Alloprevotella sp.]|nr:radical SAM/SPASM domain protein, ACGX system [Alloprevotella sp.]
MDYFAFQWHITDECDQRCKHCYIFSEGHPKLIEMPWEKLVAVLANIERMAIRMQRLPYLYITGGDPILHSCFWRFLDLIHSKGIPFTIMGNPFHLTDEVCFRLKALGCRKYQLSLDGLRETHDRFRKSGSFDSTLQAIDTIRHSGLHCAVMSTISAMNIDEIPQLIDILVEHNVDIFAFGRYCPTSEDKAYKDTWHIEPKRYREFLDKCWAKFELYKDSNTTFNLKDHLWTLFLYEKGLFKIPDGLDEDTIYDGCNCGNCHFTISAEGRLMACRRFTSYVGTIDEEMYDVFHGIHMKKYRQHENFEKCQKCELLRFCRGCPAVAYGYTKNFYAPDPQCWKEVKNESSWTQKPVSRNSAMSAF